MNLVNHLRRQYSPKLWHCWGFSRIPLSAEDFLREFQSGTSGSVTDPDDRVGLATIQ